MADLSMSTTTGSQNCVEGVRVFEEYSLHLLPHNPAWLTTAPAWVTSLSLPHHILLANTQKWSQELSWKTHLSEEDRRGVAPPLRVGVNQMYGRHLVAARDMRAGEVVLVEPPLLLALRAKSPPYCSRCYRRAEHFTCPGCGFFLCGVECMTESHQEECAVFRRLGLADPPQDERQKEEELMCERVAAMPSEQRAQAQALLQQARKTALQQRRLDVLRQYMVQPAVRTLLTMNQSDLKRKLILSLQGNSDTGSQRYRINQKRIVDVVINQLQAATDPTLVHQVCSVWDTNGFEVPLGWGTRVHGLYPLASLLTHDCRANTQQWFTADGHLVLRAVDHIPEGSVLTTCYTDPQWATLLRQDHLRVSKQFTCTCTRCLDPTEMGTFMGSPLCQGCGGPLVSSAPLDPKSDWICHSRCPNTATAKEAAGVGAQVGRSLRGLSPTDATALNAMASHLKSTLYPTHHVLLQLHVSTLGTIVNKDLSEMPVEEIRTLAAISSLVTGVIKQVEAPLTRLTVRMAREEVRLQLQLARRGHGDERLASKNKLKGLSRQVADCELVLGWDDRMPPFSAVLRDYQALMEEQ